MKIVAIIPARGGSKGLPGKNIRLLNGKPLIAWSIEAGIEAPSVSKVVVTTDDREIAEVAKNYGAEVPFIRPDDLSTDEASGVDVVVHALEFLKAEGGEFDYVLLLQPTSPLRSVEDIENAIQIAINEEADTVLGLRHVSEPPQWMKRLNDDGDVQDYFDGLDQPATRQELDKALIVNGAIYLVKASMLSEKKTLYGGITKGYVMPKERSVDIDDALDFKLAELLIQSSELPEK